MDPTTNKEQNEDDVLDSFRSKPTAAAELEMSEVSLPAIQPDGNRRPSANSRCPIAEAEDAVESTDDMEATIHKALEEKDFVCIEEAVTVKSLTSCKTNALLKAFEVNKKLKDLAEGRGPEYKEFEMLADSVGEFSTALIDPLKSDDDLRTSFEGCFDVVLDEAIQKKQKKFISHAVIDTLLQRRWYGPFFSISNSHWTKPSFWGFLLLRLCVFIDVIMFPLIFVFCFIIKIFKRGMRKRRTMEISFLLALSEDVTEDVLELMKQSIRYVIKEYGSEIPDYCLLPGEQNGISLSELFTKLSAEVSDDHKPVLRSEDTIKISKASSSRFLDTLGDAGVSFKSPHSSQYGSTAQMLVVFVNDFRIWQQEKMENLIKTVKSDVFLVPVCVGDNVRLVDLKRFGSLYFGEYESSKAVGKAIIQRADGKDVFERYLEYFTTPCFVFMRDTLSYFTLLLLIFVVCLSPPTVEPSIVEWVVFVFFVGRIFMEVDQFVEPKKDKTGANEQFVAQRSTYESVPPNDETSENAEQPEKRLRHVVRNFRSYFSDLWNWLDFIVLITYVITFILRIISWVKSGPVPGNRLLAVAFYFYGFIAIVLTFRAFGHVMERARSMGAILIALIFIVRDVATIFFQFITMILGFSFAITNVYVVERSYVSTGNTTEELACNNGGIECWLTMMKHLGLSLLGLPELDSFSSVDSPSVFLVEILYSLFLIIGAILLVNMLIALLSNTYQSVEDNSLKEWSFKNAVTIKTYSLYHPVPVPFNILSIPAVTLFRQCERLFKDAEPHVNEEGKRHALDKLLKKLGATYFACYGYSFPLTDERKMDQLLHDSYGNRRMANQISRRVFRESRIKQRMFKTGKSAWESNEIEIEGCQLTCWGADSQTRYGARYKTPFSKEMPRIEVHILESGEKRILGVGAVFKDYKSYWMPGWRHNSVGYHADHGTIFDKENCIRGRDGDDAMAYRGDLMACEVDFDKETNESVPVKFFLNGRKVGSAIVKYPNGKAQLFPFIGMGYKGIRVLVEMCPPEEISAAEGVLNDDKVKQTIKDIVGTEFKNLEDKWRAAKNEMLQAIQNERRKEKEELRILLTELMKLKEEKEEQSS